MEFLFADYTQKTEALVTGIRLQNEAFDIYTNLYIKSSTY